jgi:orotate phosphoribosyltransferase
VYNDNRILLREFHTRKLIQNAFLNLYNGGDVQLSQWEINTIAGVATAGIGWGNAFADALLMDFVYVRDKPKDHGMKNQIEGIGVDEDLTGRNVLVVEDLISTGGSTIKAIDAVRQANGIVTCCVSIFDYGFPEAKQKFDEVNCEAFSIITFEEVWEAALEAKYLTEEQVAICKEWRQDPWNWGKRHGFPKVEKK